MTFKKPLPGNGTGLPSRSRAKPLMTQSEWASMHDSLTLALDALGDGPADVDGPFLLNCVMHQRGALKLAHRLKDRMEGRGAAEALSDEA